MEPFTQRPGRRPVVRESRLVDRALLVGGVLGVRHGVVAEAIAHWPAP